MSGVCPRSIGGDVGAGCVRARLPRQRVGDDADCSSRATGAISSAGRQRTRHRELATTPSRRRTRTMPIRADARPELIASGPRRPSTSTVGSGPIEPARTRPRNSRWPRNRQPRLSMRERPSSVPANPEESPRRRLQHELRRSCSLRLNLECRSEGHWRYARSGSGGRPPSDRER